MSRPGSVRRCRPSPARSGAVHSRAGRRCRPQPRRAASGRLRPRAPVTAPRVEAARVATDPLLRHRRRRPARRPAAAVRRGRRRGRRSPTTSRPARAGWRRAPLVAVGADLARGRAAARLPRRPASSWSACDRDDAGVWDVARGVGAEQRGLPAGAPSPGWSTGSAEPADGAGGAALVVAVVGGRGGAGATTLAAALALTRRRRGLRCLLVDADPLGGGIDLVLGGEECAGLRWPDLAARRRPGQRRGAARRAAARCTASRVLSAGPRRRCCRSAPADALGARGRPRGQRPGGGRPAAPLDDAAEHALAAADGDLLVVPAEVRAAAAAGAGRGRCRARRRATSGSSSAGRRRPGSPAAVVADALGLPLAGWLRRRARPRRGARARRAARHASAGGPLADALPRAARRPAGARRRSRPRDMAADAGRSVDRVPGAARAQRRAADRRPRWRRRCAPRGPCVGDRGRSSTWSARCASRARPAPGRWSRCSPTPTSPTCWSTGPTRSGSTAATGCSGRRVRFRRRGGGAPARRSGSPRGRPAARRRAARRSTRGCPTASGCTPCCRRSRPRDR